MIGRIRPIYADITSLSEEDADKYFDDIYGYHKEEDKTFAQIGYEMIDTEIPILEDVTGMTIQEVFDSFPDAEVYKQYNGRTIMKVGYIKSNIK